MYFRFVKSRPRKAHFWTYFSYLFQFVRPFELGVSASDRGTEFRRGAWVRRRADRDPDGGYGKRSLKGA